MLGGSLQHAGGVSLLGVYYHTEIIRFTSKGTLLWHLWCLPLGTAGNQQVLNNVC